MDEKLIKKFIEIKQKNCQTFKYRNPLLDIDVAKKLANSFVEILNDQGLNENLRQDVLKSVHKVCTNSKENHLPITDNIIDILIEELPQKQHISNTTQILDTFLIKILKNLNIASVHIPLVSMDVIKAVANLKNLPDPEINYDDISTKSKPEIENVLLKYSSEILATVSIEQEHRLCNKSEFKNLIKKCCVSKEHFQICCSVLNAIFIKTGFKCKILALIKIFITYVNEEFIDNMDMVYFSQLYPNNLQHIVTLLDIDIDTLSLDTKKSYISFAMDQFTKLSNEDINDVIMLLSHYQQWFDIYYDYHNQ